MKRHSPVVLDGSEHRVYRIQVCTRARAAELECPRDPEDLPGGNARYYLKRKAGKLLKPFFERFEEEHPAPRSTTKEGQALCFFKGSLLDSEAQDKILDLKAACKDHDCILSPRLQHLKAW